MFSIVIWHIIIHGGVITRTNGALNFAVTAILFLAAFHVSVFMLITGYYQSKSQFKLRKFIGLLLEIGFYNLIIKYHFLFNRTRRIY